MKNIILNSFGYEDELIEKLCGAEFSGSLNLVVAIQGVVPLLPVLILVYRDDKVTNDHIAGVVVKDDRPSSVGVDEGGVMEVVCLWMSIVVLSVGVVDGSTLNVILGHKLQVTNGDSHVTKEVNMIVFSSIYARNS